ncbi:MAG TPA: hypothetical protein VL625_08965 [Patescibacteria group bacterium]|nr:hypothetical protein [Patescibacteria group bacterium]
METESASQKDENAAAGGKKKLGAISLVGFFVAMVAVLVLPTTVVLVIGMLPTMAAMIGSSAGKGSKVLTIGMMNLAGCFPFLLPLWTSDHSVGHALSILMDIRSIIVMYCAAGIGYLIDWAMAGIVNTIMVQRATGRLDDVRKRQAKLVERWGSEVTGDLPLDSSGFAVNPKPAEAGEASE